MSQIQRYFARIFIKTEENSCDLERMQKSAVKVMRKDAYNGCQNGLAKLGFESLNQRRENLCLEFARTCNKHEKLQHMFPKNIKEHSMDTINNEVFRVQHENISRLQNSAIIYMRKLLNDNEQDKSKV